MNKINVSLLETEILQLERELAESQNGRKIQLLLEKKAYRRELNHERVMWMSVRLRVQNMKFSDTPTKSFFQLEGFKKSKRQIVSLIDATGNITQNEGDVRMLVKGFFSELFADKSVNKDIDVNMTNHVPVLSCDKRQRLEVPPTLEELSTALSSLEHGKTLGLMAFQWTFLQHFGTF